MEGEGGVGREWRTGDLEWVGVVMGEPGVQTQGPWGWFRLLGKERQRGRGWGRGLSFQTEGGRAKGSLIEDENTRVQEGKGGFRKVATQAGTQDGEEEGLGASGAPVLGRSQGRGCRAGLEKHGNLARTKVRGRWPG